MQSFEEGWKILNHKGIIYLENYLDMQFLCKHGRGALMTQHDSKSYDDNAECFKEHKNIFSHTIFMELYSTVYDMTAQDYDNTWAQQLYSRRQQALDVYIEKKVLPALNSALDSTFFLGTLACHWRKYTFLNFWTQRIFSYLDRFYVRAANELPLEKAGYSIFQEKVLFPYSGVIRNHLLNSINERRLGKSYPESTVAAVINIYITLDPEKLTLYRQHFEQFIFSSTKLHYTQISDQWLKTSSFSLYIQNVQQTIVEESEMACRWFHPSTQLKLLEVIRKVLVANHLDDLLEMATGIPYLFLNESREDLKLTYDLLSSLDNGCNLLASSYRDFVSEKCSNVIQQWINSSKHGMVSTEMDSQNPLDIYTLRQQRFALIKPIESLLSLYQYSCSFVDYCFHGDILFQKALQQAFEESINKPIGTHSIALLLSLYCDQLLRTSEDVLSDVMLKQSLAQVMRLFICVQDKDLFVDLFRNQLAQRILSHTSRCLESEKLMVNDLELACGSQLTFKIKGILADSETSYDVKKKFYSYLEQSCARDTECSNLLKSHQFSPFILTSTFWPTYPVYPLLNLPDELSIPLTHFTTFYTQKQTSHRRLTWVHYQETVVIEAHFQNNTYQIFCNTFHACILMLFNDISKLNMDTIVNTLKLDAVIAQKHVISLLAANLLITDNNIPETYAVAEDIISQSPIIHVPIPTQEENEIPGKMHEDRSIAIEAAMVRVMKHQKCMTHSELVSETLKQLVHFKPDLTVIDEKVKSLVEREFFKTTSNSLEYTYIP